MITFRNGAAALLLAALAACEGGTGPTAGPPAGMHLAGDLQTGVVGAELPQPLVVRVVDADGTPVPDQLVTFRVTAGNGRVASGAARTDARGEAREQWTLGPVAGDTQQVEVRVVDSTIGQAITYGTFRAVGTPGAPASITRVGADLVGSAGRALHDSVIVRVTDRYGNGVPGVAVSWTVLAGGGTIAPASSTTGRDGYARTSWTLGIRPDAPQAARATAGPLSLTFAALAVTSVTFMYRLSGDRQEGVAGTPLADSVAVFAINGIGSRVAGAVVDWTVVSGGGSVSPATSVTGADGVARARWTLGPAVGEQRLRASVPMSPTHAFAIEFTATARAPAASGVGNAP